MKKLLAIVLSWALFTTSTYASVDIVRHSFIQFEKAVTIENLDRRESMNDLFKTLIDNGVTLYDITNYVNETASEKDKLLFQEMIGSMSNEIDSIENISSKDFDYLMSQAVSMSNVTGSSYEGCPGAAAAGAVLLAGAFAMGILALYSVNAFGNRTTTTTYESFESETECDDNDGIWISIGGSYECRSSRTNSSSTTVVTTWEPSESDVERAEALGVAAGFSAFLSIPLFAADCSQ